MRIISQDGTIDIPYERMIVQILPTREESIIAYDTFMPDCDFMCMGVYSTQEKAKKAMEMLRNEYLEYTKIEDGGLETAAIIFRPNRYGLPKVFQFPQDDEVE